jgi:hypothetical protein
VLLNSSQRASCCLLEELLHMCWASSALLLMLLLTALLTVSRSGRKPKKSFELCTTTFSGLLERLMLFQRM